MRVAFQVFAVWVLLTWGACEIARAVVVHSNVYRALVVGAQEFGR